MLRYFTIFFLFFFISFSNAEVKNKIIQNLKDTDNVDFVFEQNNITESIPILSLVILIILRTLPACTNINTNLNNLRFNIKSVENIFKLLQQNKLNNLNIRHNNNNIVAKKIVLKNISFEYGEKKILNNVNYNFESGKIYGLKGESGSGKTTLIDLILGLLKPSSGQIYINYKYLLC